MFKCNQCNTEKLPTEMLFTNGGRTLYMCKECKARKSREARERGGVRWQRNKTFKNKYGITIEQYEEMLEKQGHKCKICDRVFDGKIKPDVDHCHQGNYVRGILCHACNLALGYLREDVIVVQRLLDYLFETHIARITRSEADVQIQQQ